MGGQKKIAEGENRSKKTPTVCHEPSLGKENEGQGEGAGSNIRRRRNPAQRASAGAGVRKTKPRTLQTEEKREKCMRGNFSRKARRPTSKEEERGKGTEGADLRRGKKGRTRKA